MSESSGNGLLWAMVGCGALIFLGLCVATGAGVYFVMLRGEGVRESPIEASPTPGPVPPGAPAPSPITPPSGPTGLPPPPQPAGPPFTLEATVTEVGGALSGRVRGTCRMAVEQTAAVDGLRCRTQIVCDSLLVYGGPTAGYFSCRVDPSRRSVSGSDTQTTSQDGDAAMTVDTDAGTLRIEDDAGGPNGAFTLLARLATTL